MIDPQALSRQQSLDTKDDKSVFSELSIRVGLCYFTAIMILGGLLQLS